VTQAQRSGAQRDEDQGPDHPRGGASSLRRARDRFILTQPPPPPPKPRRPPRDDEEPPHQPATGATDDERREELLAEIDELIDGR
jgi:hypothetical protein